MTVRALLGIALILSMPQANADTTLTSGNFNMPPVSPVQPTAMSVNTTGNFSAGLLTISPASPNVSTASANLVNTNSNSYLVRVTSLGLVNQITQTTQPHLLFGSLGSPQDAFDSDKKQPSNNGSVNESIYILLSGNATDVSQSKSGATMLAPGRTIKLGSIKSPGIMVDASAEPNQAMDLSQIASNNSLADTLAKLIQQKQHQISGTEVSVHDGKVFLKAAAR